MGQDQDDYGPTEAEILLHQAISSGNLELVKKRYFKSSDEAYLIGLAASKGYTKIIKWLVFEAGCNYLNDMNMMFAAANGQLEALKLLKNLGCKWYRNSCINIAMTGTLETFVWSIENGCPLYINSCILNSTNPDILKYLHEKFGVTKCPKFDFCKFCKKLDVVIDMF